MLCYKQTRKSTAVLIISINHMATITHFSKVLLSCKNMRAHSPNMQQSKLSPFSFMLGYTCWLRHTVHGNIEHTLFAEPFSVHR